MSVPSHLANLHFFGKFRFSSSICGTNGIQFVFCIYDICVVVQFYPWFKFYFPLFWGMVLYDNEFKTKGNKI